jgi:methionyl-tRNA formyltransferase
MKIKTICIAGKNNIAINIARYIRGSLPQYEIIAVCNATDEGKNNFQRSFKAFCQSENIRMVQLNEVYDHQDLLFLSLEFDKIIKPYKFKTNNLFNIHFSLLPAYKGMYTSALPILNNEKYSGATLHKIDSGIDTGDIIAQRKFEIGADTSGQELYLMYIEHGTQLIIDNLQHLLDGTFINTRQPSTNASYYSKNSLDYSNLKIDFNKTAQEIHNQIRAYSFPAYQLPVVNNISVYKSEIMSDKSMYKAGTILNQDDFTLIMASVDYYIKLYKDRREDLLQAAANGKSEVIEHFIDNNYPLFQKNKLGWDSLIVAAYNGQYELAKLLIEKYGGDINTNNNNLTTLVMYAMTYASKTDDLQLLNYLLQKRQINLSAKDAFNKDIYYYAKKYNNKNVLKVLGCQ